MTPIQRSKTIWQICQSHLLPGNSLVKLKNLFEKFRTFDFIDTKDWNLLPDDALKQMWHEATGRK